MHRLVDTTLTCSARPLAISAAALVLMACCSPCAAEADPAGLTPPPAAALAALGKGSWYMSTNLDTSNWSKTGLFYDKPWADKVDCYAGGNTTLEMYIKALTPRTLELVNAKKLAISILAIPDDTHPLSAAGANFGDYVTLTDQNWTKVSIPLAAIKDFNFRAVTAFIGIPISLGVGDFSIGIDEIRFVGGPKPVLWYGDAHPNNPIAPHGTMVVDGVTVPAVEAHYVATGGVAVDDHEPALDGGK